MVAIEAKYHTKCLASLCNRVRAAKTSSVKYRTKNDVTSAVVLAKLIAY